MSRNSGGEAGLVIALVIAAFVVGGIWSFAKYIGADPLTTGKALGWSMLFAAIAVAACWMIFDREHFGKGLLAAAVFIWPAWWNVLRSIAAGGDDPETAWRISDVWYTGFAFRWGVEAVLVAVFIGAVLKYRRDYYAY